MLSDSYPEAALSTSRNWYVGESHLQSLNLRNAVTKVSVQKYNHVCTYLLWVRPDLKSCSLLTQPRSCSRTQLTVWSDLVLTESTLQFTLAEGNQSSKGTLLLLTSVPSWGCLSVRSTSAPPPHVSEGVLLAESGAVSALALCILPHLIPAPCY